MAAVLETGVRGGSWQPVSRDNARDDKGCPDGWYDVLGIRMVEGAAGRKTQQIELLWF